MHTLERGRGCQRQPLPLTIAIIVITKQMLSFNFFGIIYFLEVPKSLFG